MTKYSLSPNYELNLISSGKYDYVLGIDEVGRGCVAGPVTVGGFLFSTNSLILEGVYDSKKLTPGHREKLAGQIREHEYTARFGSVEDIHQFGIARVIENLIEEIIINFIDFGKVLILIDGRFKKKFGSDSKQVIKGDMTYYSIAMASILAKVKRDAFMRELDPNYPNYKFAKHKGYATSEHIQAIKLLGISEIHRRNFLGKYGF